MTGLRVSALCLAAIVLSAPVIPAQDLSRYREFQLGMTLAAVATQAGMKPSDARVLHRHPALIEELEWRFSEVPATSVPLDSVRKILFSFHDGQLFRIAVSYHWDRTEGLTVDDMVDAISAMYGLATLAVTDIVPPASRVATSGDRVAAHWEDSHNSLNLFRPSFASTFGLILYSKRFGALARAADVTVTRNVELMLDGEAIRMGQQGGPARSSERQRTQESDYDARQAKARRSNKALFRP